MSHCYFCQSIKNHSGLDFIPDLENELFIATWDINPVTPGHMLIIPKRHAQYMHLLTQAERSTLLDAVADAKAYLRSVNLPALYVELVRKMQGTTSQPFLELALEKVAHYRRSPDAFNDGLNDGPAAGQTVPHFHWHIMPRWQGDTADPRGGIRHMFSGMGNYHTGPQK